MNTQDVKRKLTAILSADVEGYSRLMGEDEVGTIRTLTAYRDAMTNLILLHRGRVVDAPGDNLLAEFASVVDAVNCAVEVQRDLAERNQELPQDHRMQFRIGVNLGDVVEEEDRIYGDGVNIAARLESLADGGGICISGTVHEHIKNKMALEYEHLGKQTVKNIAEPVEVYRVLSYPGAAAHRVIKAKKAVGKKWRKISLAIAAVLVLAVAAGIIWNLFMRPSRPQFEVASVEKMAFPLPDKPSIAVLPFDNLSGDPDQEYIADGFTENIISGLAQIPDMFVIARNSVFTYKAKPVKIKQVSEELGVRYVLEGSVQRAGDRLRVTAQLIDAIEGHHLWAQRYDRELKDLFNLQDEITMKILTALQIKLTQGQLANWYKTDNFEAWSNFTKGLSFLNRLTKGDLLRARKHFEQATNLDPAYAPAWTMLAWIHTIEVLRGLSKSPGESIKQALELAQKAAELGEGQGFLHSLMNRIYRLQGKFDMAIAEGEKAVALMPNNARPHIFLAESLLFGGRPEEAIIQARTAMRLEPYYPAWFLAVLSSAYEMAGRYEEALATWKHLFERSLKGEYPPISAHVRLARNYARLDRMEKARVHVEAILKIKPDYSVEFFRKRNHYKFKDRAYPEGLVDLLIKAGLPEHPPLALPDKPSIAVLSFNNMSDDPAQEYFSDGLAEEIITALSKVSKLFVIARNSSFTYKGKPVKVQQVGRELGVKYVLEGSVRKAGNRVRITAQLIDAASGRHLWAERYDRKLDDVFALQDEITKKIITDLQVKLTEGEQARLLSRGADNLQAYLKWLEGLGYIREFSREANISARRIGQEVIRLDPEDWRGYSLLAYVDLYDIWLGLSKSRQESLKSAMALAQKAQKIDPTQSDTYRLLAHAYILMRQNDTAIVKAELALEMEPGAANPHATLGHVLLLSRRHQEAIAMLEKAIRLNPYPPSWYFDNLAGGYRLTGRYEEAIITYKKSLEKAPNDQIALVGITAAYSLSGRLDEARAAAKNLLRANPKFSVEKYTQRGSPKEKSKDKSALTTAEALYKAGLK